MLRVVHVPQVVVAAVVVAGGDWEDGEGVAGVDDGGVGEGLAQRLSQCAYGPPWWLLDRRPCADYALLHHQALL